MIDFNLIEFQNLEIRLSETLNKDGKFEQLVNIVLQNSKRGKGKPARQNGPSCMFFS